MILDSWLNVISCTGNPVIQVHFQISSTSTLVCKSHSVRRIFGMSDNSSQICCTEILLYPNIWNSRYIPRQLLSANLVLCDAYFKFQIQDKYLSSIICFQMSTNLYAITDLSFIGKSIRSY